MRYKGVKSKKDLNGNRIFSPSMVPNIPIKDTDVFLYPIFGDRLDTIAQRFYGDANLWWIIAKANELSRGQLSPSPEKKLRIPTQIDDILEAVNLSNS